MSAKSSSAMRCGATFSSAASCAAVTARGHDGSVHAGPRCEDGRVSARRTTPSLSADCSRCVGLCCVAPAFSASADFAIDKSAGHPCPNLQDDFRCGIHDCFGAGQQVSQVTFVGRDWRAEPQLAKAMFDTFAVMRQLHELLWYLTEAADLPTAAPLH